MKHKAGCYEKYIKRLLDILLSALGFGGIGRSRTYDLHDVKATIYQQK